ncbi:MAG: cbb3-type cytochrome c oxidase subunit II [Planctomycetes bacterium]|nr:cbb3-type cytochrome c oxidase subunit II [Planctomycetota bacterium]
MSTWRRRVGTVTRSRSGRYQPTDGGGGPASRTHEYHNALQRPVLFGTRRIGPDLIREAARRSNDWHLAHFYKPTSVVPSSVMPEYKWFFDEDGYPNKKGMAIITYMQWLGSRLPEYPYFRGVGAIGPA